MLKCSSQKNNPRPPKHISAISVTFCNSVGGIGGVTVVEVVGKEEAGLVGLQDSLKIQRLVNHQQPL